MHADELAALRAALSTPFRCVGVSPVNLQHPVPRASTPLHELLEYAKHQLGCMRVKSGKLAHTCEQCERCCDGCRVIHRRLRLAIHLQVATQHTTASTAGASAVDIAALAAVVKAVQVLRVASAHALQRFPDT